MGDRKIRVSEELYDQLAKVADRSGRSMRDLVEEAVRAYLLGTESVEKPIKSIQGKIIPLQYPSRCFFCRKQIKQGELAYWAKYTYSDNTTKSYVICLDCYYKDTALAEWYLKKKKLEAIVRGLKKQADELAEKVGKLRTEYDVISIRKEVASLWNEFKQYVLTPNSSTDSDKLQEFIDRVNELLDKLVGIEASLRVEVGVIKRRKGVIYAKERTA